MSGGVKEVSAEYRSGELLDGCPVGYKQTEVGIIPKDWDILDIDSISTKVGSGKTPKGGSSVYVDNGRPLVRSQNVGWGRLLLNDVAFISEDVHETFLGSELQEGDVLLNITGASIGRCSIANKELSGGNVNQHVCIIRVDNKKVDTRIICSLILSSNGQAQIDSFQAGGNREGLNFTQVKALKFALSRSTEEQTAIANALSDVDALIASLETLITKKRAIKTAAMQQLLTGKKRLPPFDKTHTGYKQTELGEIPEDWKIHELGNIGAFTKGAGIKKDESNSGNIPCIRYGEIYTKHCDYIKTYSSYISESVARTATKLLKGDLLFAGSGETKEEIGKCVAFVDDLVAYAGGDIVILRPQWGDSLLLGYCLNSDYVVKQKSSKGQGDAVVHISANALRSVQVLLPSSQVEQQSIADVLLDMDKDIDALEKRLTKTQQLKQGMMQELLTGRTRLL